MFPLVKLVFLLSILSGTANAQWGTVVAQSDTNRFITSQYKYGLVMPHQNVIVGILDTTITSVGIGGGNASQIIVGSLLDYEDNCANYSIINGVASCVGSYEKWREMEKSTSWYQADRGDTTAMFPTNYALTVSTGSDSVNIWNRDTAELWMAFDSSNLSMIRTGINHIAFKDGKLYAGNAVGQSMTITDFLNDTGAHINTSNYRPYNGNIQERNDELDFTSMATQPQIRDGTVESVAAVRDPFGLKDGLGRPQHWWNAATAGGISTYNPYKNSVYDSNSAGTQVEVDYTSRGASVWVKDTTHDEVIYNRTGLDRTADDYAQDYSWSYGASGAKSLPSGEDYDYGVFIEGGSIVGRNEDVVVVGGSFGTYLMHQGGAIDTGEDGAKVKITATVNTPVQLGDCVLALALEDNTTDSSTDANDMTTSGSPGTATAVFGNGYSSTVDSYLYRNGDSDFNLGTDDWYVAMWMKTHSATNPGATERLWSLNYAPEGAHTYQVDLHIATDGTIGLRIWDDGGSTTDNVDPIGDFYDGEWHHVVATRGGSNWHMIIDGINVGTTAVANAAGVINTDDLNIGTYWNGNNPYTGLFDDFSLGKQEMTTEVAARIHAEGRKKLGMGTPVFTRTTDDALLSNNVVDVDALDNGIWAVVFSDAATAQVFDGRIPIQQIAVPAGTVKSVALIQSPGTDSVGVAIGTSANLKFVQPSVNLKAAMAHQYKEPIHVGESVVVDSAGIDGIFWTGTDGIDAANNAGLKNVLVSVGTYGPVIIDHDGMTLRGSGVGVNGDGGTLFDGGGSNDAVNISANHVTVRDLAYYTAPGGGGGGYHGMIVETGASDAYITNTTCRDADNNCISVQSAFARIIGNNFTNTDNWCIWSNTNGSTFSTNIMNDIANGILITTGDGNVMAGNIIRGGTAALQMDSGGNYNVFTGNKYSGNLTDNGTGNIKIGNEGTSW